MNNVHYKRKQNESQGWVKEGAENLVARVNIWYVINFRRATPPARWATSPLRGGFGHVISDSGM